MVQVLAAALTVLYRETYTGEAIDSFGISKQQYLRTPMPTKKGRKKRRTLEMGNIKINTIREQFGVNNYQSLGTEEA